LHALSTDEKKILVEAVTAVRELSQVSIVSRQLALHT
jgi:hypothetical protein